MALTIKKWTGNWLRRAAFGNAWALAQACCCNQCCCSNWPNTNTMTVVVTGDVEATITLEPVTYPLSGGCAEWYKLEEAIPWQCVDLVPAVDLEITLICPIGADGPEDVLLNVNLTPSNACNNLVGGGIMSGTPTCSPFSAEFDVPWEATGEGCLCSEGIHVAITENL